jgi:VanZ family protein
VISLWLPVAAFMAAIYYGAALTAVPGPVATVSDTVLHVGGYAVLALLTLRATAGGRWAGVTWRALLWAFVIATVHGMSVEVEQMFVPSRFAEWRDVGNDMLGAVAGLSAAWAWGKLFTE